MKETHVREHLSVYLDKMLTAEENLRIENHLRDCRDCQEVFTELKNMINWMKTIPKPAANFGLETRLIARLKDKKLKNNYSLAWKSVSGGLATAVVALLVFVMIKDNRMENYPKERTRLLSEEIPRSAAPNAALKREEAPEFDFGSAGEKGAAEFKAGKSRFDRPVTVGSAVGRKELTNSQDKKSQFSLNQKMDQSTLSKSKQIAGDEISSEKVPAELMMPAKNLGAIDRLKVSKDSVTEPWKFEKSEGDWFVVRSKAEWVALQKQKGLRSVEAAYDTVDFSKQMIIVVFKGPSSNQGETIKIISEEYRDGPHGQTLIITTRTTTPPQKASMANRAYDLKVLPIFQGPIHFRDVK